MAIKSAKRLKMVNEISLHEGDILRLMVKRSGYRVDEFAKMLEINPNSLSRIFNSERVTKKVRERACAILGVDVSIFDTGVGYDISDNAGRLGEPDEEYLALKAEVERLHDEIRKLSAEVASEKGINADLRKLLLKISGAG